MQHDNRILPNCAEVFEDSTPSSNMDARPQALSAPPFNSCDARGDDTFAAAAAYGASSIATTEGTKAAGTDVAQRIVESESVPSEDMGEAALFAEEASRLSLMQTELVQRVEKTELRNPRKSRASSRLSHAERTVSWQRRLSPNITLQHDDGVLPNCAEADEEESTPSSNVDAHSRASSAPPSHSCNSEACAVPIRSVGGAVGPTDAKHGDEGFAAAAVCSASSTTAEGTKAAGADAADTGESVPSEDIGEAALFAEEHAEEALSWIQTELIQRAVKIPHARTRSPNAVRSPEKSPPSEVGAAALQRARLSASDDVKMMQL
jgi:hypothetical protein